jgi:hypothetical protein
MPDFIMAAVGSDLDESPKVGKKFQESGIKACQ